MKNNSTSSFLPNINKNTSLLKASSSVSSKPALSKIIYPPPLSNKSKQNYQSVMLQSCISNKRYDDLVEQNNQRKIKQGLDPSEQGSRKNIESIPPRVGKQAPIQYYHQYKSLQRTLLKKDLNTLPVMTGSLIENPVVSLLQKADSLRIFPLCLGLVKSKGEASILNINNYNLGDRYVIALAAGLKKARSIQKMYLSGNRITDISLNQLADAVSPQITVLQLSHNKITSINKRLLQLIIEPEYRLQSLGIASNFLMPSSAETILRNVRYSKHIHRLDLRDNRISSFCGEALSQLIEKSNCLQQLYIGVNYLGKSGQNLFKKIAINKNLRVFDYSLNQLGQESGQGVAQAISNCLRVNKTLQHLDLSFNNFNKESSQLISEGLEPNKTLLGFHFKGNYGYVNSKGFLILAERQGTYLHSVDKFQIDGFEVTSPRENNAMRSHLYRNVCWICEGWYEHQFKLTVPKNEQKVLVYIHFDFQRYEPRLISLSQHVKYVTMVPPKKYRYFFTVNNQTYLDQHAARENLALLETYSYQMDHLMRTFKIETVNYLSGKAKRVANEYKQVIIKTLPRNNGLTTKKQKIPWSFGCSVWAKEYKLEDQQMLRKCFERDWKCSKLSNLVKNQTDQDKVKESLWKTYPLIKNLYKQFSSWNPFGDIWAVSSQPFTQFCQQSKIINKQMPLKIIDLTFITTNSMSGPDWKGNILNPERGLVRFQFMQSLVRLAEQKYKKLGLTDNFADSIENILRDHVVPLAQSYSPHQWRSTKFFNEFNDTLIKKYRPIFSAVYKRNSKLKVKPGEKPYMCLMQFKGIFQKLGLTTTLPQRDIFVACNNAMMTQVDQLQNQRFIRMTEIQFIEGLARCANSLPSQYSLQQIYNPPLHFKFEWLIHQIKSFCSQEIRAQFPDSQKTIFKEQDEQQ